MTTGNKRWMIAFGASLVFLSAALYVMHFMMFHDAHHILTYLVGDIAFVPLEVLLVTLVLHQVLERRERGHRLHRMNMVIGAFFSEVGTELLRRFRRLDARALPAEVCVDGSWSGKNYAAAVAFAADWKPSLTLDRTVVGELRDFLLGHRAFLLRLLENPNLLEHERFTDLLWAVLHLAEELQARDSAAELPDSDLKHLAGDVDRAYGRLLRAWLSYMNHLRRDYPYLYSLAIRQNPMSERTSAVVTA